MRIKHSLSPCLNLESKSFVIHIFEYITAEENVSNPAGTSLHLINFYVLELEFVMTKNSILLISIPN